MAKKIISLIIVFALVFAGGYYTCLQLIPDATQTNAGPTYATKPVTRGDLKVGINITGQLNANSGSSVVAPLPNGVEGSVKFVVEEVFVKENDLIKKGDPVVRLSTPNLAELIGENNNSLDKKYQELSDIQKEIDAKTLDLGKMINKTITSYSDVNPSDGIVISSPIAGRITGLSVKEGEKVKDGTIAKIVNDSKFKITFKCNTNEFPSLKIGQKVLLNYSVYEGYYEGVINDLNSNAVPNSDKISYIHNGVIEAKNPGLVQPGTSVSVSTNNNGVPGITLTYAGKVDSYLDEANAYTTQISDAATNKTVLATDVYVSDNEFVEKGQAIVKIAGNDVSKSIQDKIDLIKAEYAKIKTKTEEIDKIKKSINNLMDFSTKLMVAAPSDGIVAYQRYMVGDSFQASSTSNRWDLEVVSLYNSNQMSINTQVSDLDVNYVQQGATVEVTVDALPGKTFEGIVDRLYQYTDNGKVVYNVNISVTGGEGLRPGMNTNCFVDAGESLNTLLVPIEAVFEEDFKQKVEVLNKDGIATAVEIEIGLMNDRYVEVLSGLEEGQEVVTGSSGDLMPSQSVDKDNSLLPSKKE
ncbi:MAG: efflux RND transporter periplasmic adaptor subunit [Clostridium sp.]